MEVPFGARPILTGPIQSFNQARRPADQRAAGFIPAVQGRTAVSVLTRIAAVKATNAIPEPRRAARRESFSLITNVSIRTALLPLEHTEGVGVVVGPGGGAGAGGGGTPGAAGQL